MNTFMNGLLLYRLATNETSIVFVFTCETIIILGTSEGHVLKVGEQTKQLFQVMYENKHVYRFRSS
jgi:hypothetical protein